MQPLGVEPGDPSGGLSYDGCPANPRSRPVDQYGLVRPDSRFHRGVVQGVGDRLMEPAMPAAVSASVKSSEVHCRIRPLLGFKGSSQGTARVGLTPCLWGCGLAGRISIVAKP